MKNHASRHWVIIPAAGIGARMRADRPKQYLNWRGATLIEHTLRCFLSQSLFEAVAVGISSDDTFWSSLDISNSDLVCTYTGGTERADTVARGLEVLADRAHDEDWVWVHDAARPQLDAGSIETLARHLEGTGTDGVVLAVPVADTLKRASKEGLVLATVDRQSLWRAQTPQVFRFGALRAALEHCIENGLAVTDESSAMEALGYSPKLIEGSERNIKVTRPGDMELLRSKQSYSGADGVRIGTGFDVHAFGEGDHITLGGVEIACDQGLVAHSDGDVLLHALCDALLGSLALGDIGHHFPDTDPQWKGADSRDLLRAVNALITQEGYRVSNVDSTIMAQAPKMAPHLETMRDNIAEDLGIDSGRVGIKATTTEKLGFVGRKEGIACQATVLVAPL